MAKFCTLFSGSTGNCTYIAGSDTAVLVDAGRSCKQILAAMDARGIDPRTIQAILITHEHTDHISALKVFLKKYNVPVYASEEVLQKLLWDQVLLPEQARVAVTDRSRFAVGSFEIESFDTPHDSVHSLDYRICTADGRKIAVATDLGYITDAVREMLTGCDLVLLESNYDPNMLSVSAYPYHLKRRIASNTGHLSNEACAEELIHLVKTGSTRFVLGHLSQNNNTPDVAYQASFSQFVLHKMKENIDFVLKVAPRLAPLEMVVL